MRVVRSTTFQVAKGVWEKIEVELDDADLLPDELAAAPHVQPQLLELRIEKHLAMHLLRAGELTKDEVTQKLAELDSYRASLLRMQPKKTLKMRGHQNGE